MPAVRGVNLRSGDLNEEYGLFLLRLIGAVAPVPRTEDVGVDAFVTLLPREGKLFRASETILVQLKSDSVSHVFFDADAEGKRKPKGETAWLRALGSPFFFGSVSRTENGASGRLRLYTSHALYGTLFNDPTLVGIGVCFEGEDARGFQANSDDVEIVHLGPPAVELDLVELADDAIRAERIKVLQEWAAIGNRNLKIGPTGMMLNCSWTVNVLPDNKQFLIGLNHLNTSDGIQRANREAALGLQPLLAERLMQGTEEEIDAILVVLDSLERRGVDLQLDRKAIEEKRNLLKDLRQKRQWEITNGAPEGI